MDHSSTPPPMYTPIDTCGRAQSQIPTNGGNAQYRRSTNGPGSFGQPHANYGTIPPRTSRSQPDPPPAPVHVHPSIRVAIEQQFQSHLHVARPRETSYQHYERRSNSHCCLFLLVFIAGLVLGYMSVLAHWKVEHLGHARWLEDVEKTRREWVQEKLKHEQEEKMEEEKRRRSKLTWGPVVHGHCMRYQTRHYSAQLRNIPQGLDPVKECRMLELEINGKKVTPNECEYMGQDNVWGNWYIDYGEATCTTWWSQPQDKGCTAQGSGYRRFESRLENVQNGDSWERMCESAPIQFNRYSFESPHICHKNVFGMFGMWDVADHECI